MKFLAIIFLFGIAAAQKNIQIKECIEENINLDQWGTCITTDPVLAELKTEFIATWRKFIAFLITYVDGLEKCPSTGCIIQTIIDLYPRGVTLVHDINDYHRKFFKTMAGPNAKACIKTKFAELKDRVAAIGKCIMNNVSGQ